MRGSGAFLRFLSGCQQRVRSRFEKVRTVPVSPHGQRRWFAAVAARL